MNRPQPDEYASWGGTYIEKVTGDLFEDLENQVTALTGTLLRYPELANFAYAPGKWTIKELLGHMIDTERILAYRLTTFVRNDQTPLPGFEEDDYVRFAGFADRELEDLVGEFVLLRQANLHFFHSITPAQLDRRGYMADGRSITARALLYVIAGHVNHHMQVLESRYINEQPA
ncbi:DinB family protein [Pedobacter yulinensis]|uniref:DinB family protein n=1 Tax=Pedobacter yulinensis TaxID=2126353 RepID=A0A2T3HRX7_9SPHI|nr:DinB family protein [Pedobacter yulinensis]PST85137.1 DinB family protein [Pedobacter yulinensis]